MVLDINTKLLSKLAAACAEWEPHLTGEALKPTPIQTGVSHHSVCLPDYARSSLLTGDITILLPAPEVNQEKANGERGVFWIGEGLLTMFCIRNVPIYTSPKQGDRDVYATTVFYTIIPDHERPTQKFPIRKVVPNIRSLFYG